jgi:hypothetical protein
MKMVALGAPAPRPYAPPEPEPRPAPASPILYAAVEARDAQGRPTRVSLPGPVAGGRCGLYGPGGRWAAHVHSDGTVRSDGTRDDILAAIRPGVRIVAACDPSGRILALGAVARRHEPGKTKQSAAPSRTFTRFGGPVCSQPA